MYRNKGDINRNHTILPLIPTVVWCHNEAKNWHHTTIEIRGSIV